MREMEHMKNIVAETKAQNLANSLDKRKYKVEIVL